MDLDALKRLDVDVDELHQTGIESAELIQDVMRQFLSH